MPFGIFVIFVIFVPPPWRVSAVAQQQSLALQKISGMAIAGYRRRMLRLYGSGSTLASAG